MADSAVPSTDWQELHAHRGSITALEWTPDGSTLISGSFDGEVRAWRGDEYRVIRRRPEPATSPPSVALIDVTWTQSEGGVVIPDGNTLNVYKEGNSVPISTNITGKAVGLKCDNDGTYIALIESQLDPDANRNRYRFCIRDMRALAQNPIIDSDLFSQSDFPEEEFAWHPKGGLLAILFEREIHFASVAHRGLLPDSWWVGPRANSFAWISDDEIAVAFGDSNIRIYSWNENLGSRFDTAATTKAHTVLELHTSPVTAVVSGREHNICASIDLSDEVHVWSRDGQSLDAFAAPHVDLSFGTKIALNPARPVLALARANKLYVRTLDLPEATPIKLPSATQPEGLLSHLLMRAKLRPAAHLTSDDAANEWSIALYTNDNAEALSSTIHLRRVAKLTGELCEIAAQAATALWHNRKPDLKLTNSFEDLKLAEPEPRMEPMESVRQGLRQLLENALAVDGEPERGLALCAYSALGYLNRMAFEALHQSTRYDEAIRDLRDDNLRLKFKDCRKAMSRAKSAEDVAIVLDLVCSGLNTAIAKLKNLLVASSQDLNGMSDLNAIQDIIVVAALQERDAIREHLAALDIPCQRYERDDRLVEVFRIADTRRGDLIVGMMTPLEQGKSETKSLLQSINSHLNVKNVVLVGMMAGIKGKCKLLDVIVPFTVFDATSIGTRDGRFVAEPKAGTMSPKLNSRASLLNSDVIKAEAIKQINHKHTVTVAAKIDDITHGLAEAALNVDRENIVGLEMEASALVEMQTRQFGGSRSNYLMIKGVADYAGERPDEAEIESLQRIAGIGDHLLDPDPTNSRDLKKALQREATRRAFIVALELLKDLHSTGR